MSRAEHDEHKNIEDSETRQGSSEKDSPVKRKPLWVSVLMGVGYYVYRVYEVFRLPDYHSYHFEIETESWLPKLRIIPHEEYMIGKSEEIKQVPALLTRRNILQALRIARRGCLFIIYKLDEDRFIQFWVSERSILFNFPMNDENGMKKYKYLVLGVLAEYGYFRCNTGKMAEVTDPKKLMSFVIYDLGDLTNIDVNMGYDIELAADVAYNILKRMAGGKYSRLQIEVG